MSEDLKKAISAIKLGDKETARRILVKILKSDSQNEFAWLWMTKVVDTNEKRLDCLQKVLEINPRNEVAKRGIRQLQGKQSKATKNIPKRKNNNRLRIWLFAILGLFIFLALLGSIVTGTREKSDTSINEQAQETLRVLETAPNHSKPERGWLCDYDSTGKIRLWTEASMDATVKDVVGTCIDCCVDVTMYEEKLVEGILFYRISVGSQAGWVDVDYYYPDELGKPDWASN